MHTLLSLIALTSAFAASPLEGNFSRSHQIAFLSYDEKGCGEDKGQWQDDVCVFDTEDTVTVKQVAGGFSVAVNTVTTNAHECNFGGKGRAASPRSIVALDGACRIQLSYAQDGSVTVKTLSSACNDLCGMNARLDVERAVRK